MLDFPLWKKLFYGAIALFCVLAAVPTLYTSTGQLWPTALPDPEVNLGLDLAGGSHILLEADAAQVRTQRLQNFEEDVQVRLDNAEPAIDVSDVSTRDGRLTFLLDSTVDVDRTRELLLPLMAGEGLTQEWDLAVEDETRFVFTPTESGLDEAISQAMDSATDVVRSRIDSLGTREPTIIRQGDTRIVVQVPGLSDPDQLKALIGKTAKLEFKMVLGDAFEDGIPRPGTEIVPWASEQDAQEFGTYGLVLQRLGGIQGDSLTSAGTGVEQETNEPVVTFRFDQQASARFAKLTTENVGQQFAIVLDGAIISAPRIISPIVGGSGQIEGRFTPESANELAISLSSGALPVDLGVIEERTVGPDLGRDSIRKGMITMMIGSIMVVVLMIATYGRFGVYATAALVINVLMILGIMAMLNTTLTLPGIAGFVLTIGAAVDANVLINERIREERKRGRRVVAAVENGYKEASRAIYDANITNLIAGALLFIFGSGPVRGFAVVLVIGLFTSVFTALTLTRMWVSGWLRKTRPNDITI